MKTITKLLALSLAIFTLSSGPNAHARVTKIIIDETVPLPVTAQNKDVNIPYEIIAGRAFGELDPALPQNAIIQDIDHVKDSDGKVRYLASFVIYKPVNKQHASGMLWHEVPNRGRVYPFAPQEQAAGDIYLASAWQGDNAGATTTTTASSEVAGRIRVGCFDQLQRPRRAPEHPIHHATPPAQVYSTTCMPSYVTR